MSELMLIVRLAGERVAVRAEAVEAVVEIDAISPVPRAPGHVAGLAALRSRVLTVVDASASLGIGGSAHAGLADAILVDLGGHPYALLVDAVEDVVEHEGEVIAVATALGKGWSRISCGMVETADGLLLLVDPAAIVAGPAAQAA